MRTCLPDTGLHTLFELLNDVESFIAKFDIPYRIIELCAEDIGFTGHKEFDIEIYFPGEQKFKEVASITWCHDFQARRMNFKFKESNKKYYAHTLNATGLAVGRVLAALIEYDRIE